MKKVMLFLTVLLGGAMVCLAVGTCKYCGSSSYGRNRARTKFNITLTVRACVLRLDELWQLWHCAEQSAQARSTGNKCVYCGRPVPKLRSSVQSTRKVDQCGRVTAKVKSKQKIKRKYRRRSPGACPAWWMESGGATD